MTAPGAEHRPTTAGPERKSPFREVVDEMTDGCGCACHTGLGYNTACEHCQPEPTTAEEQERWALDAIYTAETQDWAHRIQRLLTDLARAEAQAERYRAALDYYAAPQQWLEMPPRPWTVAHDAIKEAPHA